MSLIIKSPYSDDKHGIPMLRRFIRGFFENEFHTIILWMSGTGLAGLRANGHCFIVSNTIFYLKEYCPN
jgi:hypothetical protein